MEWIINANLHMEIFRFGLPAHSAANDEERKKARLERFSQGTKTDTLEEEKRKARAMRSV